MSATFSEAIRRRIEEHLAAIEREHGVRILIAVESGSRAWGFPSPDSDYDARFVFVRPRAAYFSIEPPRDVIETPIEGEFDVNGWDLRKALQLACRSNAVLLEWLVSPIRYRDAGDAAERLLSFATAASRLAALEYHYDRLARGSLEQIAADGPVPLKRYCYALRPAAALIWLRRHRSPPPMDLPSLLHGIDPPGALVAAVESLVRLKAEAAEAAAAERFPPIDEFIATTLAVRAPRPESTLLDAETTSRANGLFRTLVDEFGPH